MKARLFPIKTRPVTAPLVSSSSLYDPADIGRRKPAKKHRNILLLGETGSGKSTFINYLANYFLGGKMCAPVVIIPTKWQRTLTVKGYAVHNEADLDKPNVSQTKSSTAYRFLKEGVIYCFIDTPGFCDTANSADYSTDEQNSTVILRAASQMEEIHAIIIILKGSNPRLTVNIKTTLQRIAGNFPDVFRSNMLIVYTNTNLSKPSFNEEWLFCSPIKSFTVNNCVFVALSTEWTEDDLKYQEKCWEKSMNMLKEIVDTVALMKSRPTRAFLNILSIRHEINRQQMLATHQIAKEKHLVDALQKLRIEEDEIGRKVSTTREKLEVSERDISSCHSKQRETTVARLQAEGEAKLLALASLSREISSVHTRVRDTPYCNTLCRSCLSTCHERCNLDYSLLVGDNIFKNCACMGATTTCIECGCHWTTHVHDKYVFEQIVITESTENMSILQSQRRRMLEASKPQAVQQEAERCNALLAALRQKSCDYLAAENHLQQLKEEALRKKKEAERAMSQAKLHQLDIEARRADLEALLQEAKRELGQAESSIQRKCIELKAICSHFDFVKELTITKELIQTSLATLLTSQDREGAEASIQTLHRLAEDLRQATN